MSGYVCNVGTPADDMLLPPPSWDGTPNGPPVANAGDDMLLPPPTMFEPAPVGPSFRTAEPQPNAAGYGAPVVNADDARILAHQYADFAMALGIGNNDPAIGEECQMLTARSQAWLAYHNGQGPAPVAVLNESNALANVRDRDLAETVANMYHDYAKELIQRDTGNSGLSFRHEATLLGIRGHDWLASGLGRPTDRFLEQYIANAGRYAMPPVGPVANYAGAAGCPPNGAGVCHPVANTADDMLLPPPSWDGPSPNRAPGAAYATYRVANTADDMLLPPPSWDGPSPNRAPGGVGPVANATDDMLLLPPKW